MNQATFHKLDFDSILTVLASHCATSLGKSLVEKLSPATKTHVVRDWLGQVRELSLAVIDHSYPPFGGVYDVRDHVRASGFPAPLEAEQLSKIADTLAATAHLRKWLETIACVAPSLARLLDRVLDLSEIGVAIHEAIDERGEVRDHASPRLGSIRRTIEESKARVRSVFERLVRQSGLTKLLQYGGTTFHDDRMVLPLKAEYRGRVPGIIHRSSDSGATLFIEPAESVELNNTIVRLRDEEKKEITQILKHLTQRIHLNAQAIIGTLGGLAVLDLVAAKCRYAKKRKCVCPEIDEAGRLELHEARHPLLLELFDEQAAPGDAKREVVPIDIRLGDDFDVLIMTGPNTGGKTVTLKNVGLLALMTQCGIPIPAREDSRMPVFSQIFIDIGDEQSLQQSLSTFSSHLSNQLEILRTSGTRSLVLIDELGAGTDPDEGAAIGRAIITELLSLKARAIVTTHLSALKAVAFTAPRAENASVEFDSVSLKPTYHVRLGEPGNSNALIIAKRLGMPERLVQLAKSYLDDTTRALNKAIAGTLDSRREAEAARRAAREAELVANHEREKFERERKELEKSQEEFQRWTVWVNALRPGDTVYLRNLNRPARVVRMQLHKQTALVSAGAMDIEVSLRDIAEPKPE